MKETMLYAEVTYTLEQAGKFYVMEHVPARVCKDTGEQLFSPETVQHIQVLIKSNGKPDRVIETPVYKYTYSMPNPIETTRRIVSIRFCPCRHRSSQRLGSASQSDIVGQRWGFRRRFPGEGHGDLWEVPRAPRRPLAKTLVDFENIDDRRETMAKPAFRELHPVGNRSPFPRTLP
jgi:hypothetical protein